MKAGWVTKHLGNVCTLQRGFDLPTQQRTQGIFPLVSSSGIIDTHNEAPVKAPGVVTGRSGSIGNVFYIERDFWPLNTTLYVRDFHGNDPRFVFHLLSQIDLKRFAGGAGVPTLNRNDVHGVPVFVPEEIEEQQRIVAILDDAFAGIDTVHAAFEQSRQNALAVFESHLQSVFSQRGQGWEEKSFEECIESAKYTIKIQRKDFLENGEFPIVSQEAELINGYWNNADDLFKVTTPVVVFGDHTRALKYIDFDFVLGADGVKILCPKQFLHPKFFFYALRASPVKSLGYARHFRLLKELSINYPKVPAEQSAIADRLDRLSEETLRLEALYQRKLEALDELKQSLLHQAFSGQL